MCQGWSVGGTPRNYRQWLPPPSPNRHCFGRLAQMRAEGVLRTATQSMITGNRGDNGLGPVIIDADLGYCGAIVSVEVILPRPDKQELHLGQRQMVWHTTLSPRPCSIAPASLSVDSLEPTSEPWRRVNRHLFVPGCGLPRLNLVRSLVDTSRAPSSRRPQRR